MSMEARDSGQHSGSRANGKIALVTGAGSGMGRATALLLAREGASAVVVGDIDAASAEATASTIRTMGVQSVAVGVDVSDRSAVDGFVGVALQAFGGLDIGVNCAGVDSEISPIDQCSDEEWRRVLSVNLDGVFYCMRAETRAMAGRQDCSIINIASAAAVDPIPNMGSYVASKFGVVGLTRSTAGEFVRRGIRVNAVLPGAIRTPMWEKHAQSEEGRRHIEGRLSMGRPAEPDEVAEAIVWLCSPGASYVTGLAMLVDGGAHAYRG